jgi:enoyl-CoA hydratase
MTKDLLLERDGHIATLRINRPNKLNAMTVDMDRVMNEYAYEINNDRQIRSVILTGEGDRAFCAGSDITDLDDYGDNFEYRNRFDARLDYARAVYLIRKPVVAGLFGYVIGGGLEMCAASDIRICTPDTKFGAGEIRWGWHGGSGQTQLLTHCVGAGNASLLLLIGAEQALTMGLVQEIVAPEDLHGRVREIAQSIADKGPVAIQMTKHMVRVAQNTALDVGLMWENDSFAYCMTTEDAQEGQQAFSEKRPPVFRGK